MVLGSRKRTQSRLRKCDYCTRTGHTKEECFKYKREQAGGGRPSQGQRSQSKVAGTLEMQVTRALAAPNPSSPERQEKEVKPPQVRIFNLIISALLIAQAARVLLGCQVAVLGVARRGRI